MNRFIRPSGPSDAAAIVGLMRIAGLNPLDQANALHWKYWQARVDWPGPRSFVFERDGEIVAHAGTVPGACLWQDQRLSVLHLIDWAAVASGGGAGFALLKHLQTQADALIGVDGSQDTLRILPVLGFKRLGTATGYTRVLHATRYLGSRTRWGWRKLPKIVRAARWALAAPATRTAGWTVQAIDRAGLAALGSRLPQASGGSVIMERSVELLRHYLDCPIASMQLYSADGPQAARGYFMLAVVPGQARLVDCWVDRAQADSWRGLIDCVIECAARLPQVAELATITSDARLAACLVASGFHARSEKPVQILMRKGTAPPDACPQVHMIESDGAYRHALQGEFWA